jgi:hypothetical protein
MVVSMSMGIEGDKLKFNLESIQDRRRRYQEERKRLSE